MVFVVYCRVREEKTLVGLCTCVFMYSLIRHSLGHTLSTILMWKQVSNKPREVEDTVLYDRDAHHSECQWSSEKREDGEVDRNLDWSAKAS